MKKMFFIMLSVMLTGCVNPENLNVPEVQRHEKMYIEYTEGFHRGIAPVHFNYNGHSYIGFISSESHSIVHDPDCECHKNNTHESYFEY
jgi:hypothetical protein